MRMAITRISKLCFMFFWLSGLNPLLAQDCKPFEHARSERLLRFLESTVPSDQNAACLTFAIRALGKRCYEPAIGPIVKLLEFQRPLTADEKIGVRDRFPAPYYPAVEAMEEMTSRCRATTKIRLAVLGALENGAASTKARENAVEIWMFLYRDDRAGGPPAGVASLRREAEARENSAARERLLWAISKALETPSCKFPISEAAKCKAAANTGDPD